MPKESISEHPRNPYDKLSPKQKQGELKRIVKDIYSEMAGNADAFQLDGKHISTHDIITSLGKSKGKAGKFPSYYVDLQQLLASSQLTEPAQEYIQEELLDDFVESIALIKNDPKYWLKRLRKKLGLKEEKGIFSQKKADEVESYLYRSVASWLLKDYLFDKEREEQRLRGDPDPMDEANRTFNEMIEQMFTEKRQELPPDEYLIYEAEMHRKMDETYENMKREKEKKENRVRNWRQAYINKYNIEP